MDTYRRKPNTECFICHTPLYRRPSILEKNNGKAYCSQKCFGLSNRNETPCIVCGTPILASKHSITCSRACANRNRKGIFYGVGRPKSKVVKYRQLRLRILEDRGGKCERCFHPNVKILEVHHIIHRKDGGSDDLDNLELLCPNCHMTEHKGFAVLENARVGSLTGLENRGSL